jgi:hypothetical protein
MAHIDAANLMSLARKSANTVGGYAYLSQKKIILKDSHYGKLMTVNQDKVIYFKDLVFVNDKSQRTNMFQSTGIVSIQKVDFGLPAVISDRPKFDYHQQCYIFGNSKIVYAGTSTPVGYECRYLADKFWKHSMEVSVEVLDQKSGFRAKLRSQVLLPLGGIAKIGNQLFINNRGLVSLGERAGSLAVTARGFGITLGIEKKK